MIGARIDGILGAIPTPLASKQTTGGPPAPKMIQPDAPVGDRPTAPRTSGVAGGWLSLRSVRTMAAVAAIAGATIAFTTGPALASDCQVPTTASMDANEVELRTKVCRLVDAHFGGDYDRAFAHYSRGDDAVDGGELRQLLADAGIGNGFTRGMWVDGILAQFDGSAGNGRNGRVDKAEYDRAFD